MKRRKNFAKRRNNLLERRKSSTDRRFDFLLHEMAKMKQKTDFCDIRKKRTIRAGLFGFTLKTQTVRANEQYASKKKTEENVDV